MIISLSILDSIFENLVFSVDHWRGKFELDFEINGNPPCGFKINVHCQTSRSIDVPLVLVVRLCTWRGWENFKKSNENDYNRSSPLSLDFHHHFFTLFLCLASSPLLFLMSLVVWCWHCYLHAVLWVFTFYSIDLWHLICLASPYVIR
ncbi:hypothetical protein SLEP1_g12607 [Rubroshorea leprosula]|nr:hypothetical protein SLEP1_g12607 [Rubroshorea leprosula]